MAILHVAITGRDRRHLSELRDKFRVVVVGARETRRCIVVDAYIPADRVDWLQKRGTASSSSRRSKPPVASGKPKAVPLRRPASGAGATVT